VQKSSSARPPSLANKILSSLPHDQFEMLSPHMTSEFLEQGVVLIEAGDELDFVYFPHNGMLSLLSVLKDGRAIETATVGREGAVGAMSGLGFYTSLVRVVVQLPLDLTKIPVGRFRKAAARSDTVRNLCIQYNEVLFLRQGSPRPAMRFTSLRLVFAGGSCKRRIARAPAPSI
jgi:CRP-like cAMP-binding protein